MTSNTASATRFLCGTSVFCIDYVTINKKESNSRTRFPTSVVLKIKKQSKSTETWKKEEETTDAVLQRASAKEIMK